MISIVTAYYNRKSLFVKTLKSVKRQIANLNEDVEVIAVDDGSSKNERLEDLTTEFPFLKVVRLSKRNKWYKNSCIPFNIGFLHAKGDKIIIQNPECLHFGNILSYTNQHLEPNKYLSFACYSLDEEPTQNIDSYIQNPEKLHQLISQNNLPNNKEGTNSWYNHSEIRPVGFHFCTAICKNDLFDLGGFDIEYSWGVAYDDNELLHRIKLKKMSIEFIDQEVVLHLNHYKRVSSLNNLYVLTYKQNLEREVLVTKNFNLYNDYTLRKTNWKVNGLEKVISLNKLEKLKMFFFGWLRRSKKPQHLS